MDEQDKHCKEITFILISILILFWFGMEIGYSIPDDRLTLLTEEQYFNKLIYNNGTIPIKEGVCFKTIPKGNGIDTENIGITCFNDLDCFKMGKIKGLDRDEIKTLLCLKANVSYNVDTEKYIFYDIKR